MLKNETTSSGSQNSTSNISQTGTHLIKLLRLWMIRLLKVFIVTLQQKEVTLINLFLYVLADSLKLAFTSELLNEDLSKLINSPKGLAKAQNTFFIKESISIQSLQLVQFIS